MNSAGSSIASKNSLSSSSSLASPLPEPAPAESRGGGQRCTDTLGSNINCKPVKAEPAASPLFARAGLLKEGGRTVAPLKALSRWLCCLANCSRVSSSRIRWSRSTCKAFCQRLLWFWASDRKSRHAFEVIKQKHGLLFPPSLKAPLGLYAGEQAEPAGTHVSVVCGLVLSRLECERICYFQKRRFTSLFALELVMLRVSLTPVESQLPSCRNKTFSPHN